MRDVTIAILRRNLRRALDQVEWDNAKADHGCTDAYCRACDGQYAGKVGQGDLASILRDLLTHCGGL